MRILNFAKRSFKEIIRDPLSIIFALALPLFLLFIFQQFNIPGEAYKIENFTPGTVVFSFAFITMFTATLVAKDRSASLLVRLGVSPMRSMDYVLGYALSVLPLVFIQNILFFVTALLLGLEFTVGILYSVLLSIPISLLFIFLGILLGTVTTDRSSAGVSSVVVQLVAFTSGMYFDGEMVGAFFRAVCDILPFKSCVDILKLALMGADVNAVKAIITLSLYLIAVILITIVVFYREINCKK